MRRSGSVVRLAPSGQRLLAFLALHQRHPRGYVASMLWPEQSQEHALASLRTTLWRVRSRASEVLSPTRHDVALHASVTVDIQQLAELAQQLLEGRGPKPTDPHGVLEVLASPGELLPGWYDDWVLMERERVRLQHVRALESLSEQLLSEQRPSDALRAALTATALEPFRDSAHAVVVRAYLSEGNTAEAIRHFRHYRSQLLEELGVEPSPALLELIHPHLTGIVG
ncbi:MAG TPA: BTAD domain-containing putative transcriptional regulator [Amycolatopsis sp.]|uniref:AfsR/SARP family transcriptional regulator n=1 Tax=Amycolatopsis sp. TaxID=37632 RepID=UPI002B4694BD|nr:BTAD domain-containing putative transcriptional regulator [Amycolatopsis sp.]HKS44495.1 BTAD domain-containing putative transcriptional regulator [Amycolatopsis sp.]